MASKNDIDSLELLLKDKDANIDDIKYQIAL